MSASKPRVLITGGAGFIGSHLARAWSNDGAEVVVFDSLRTGRLENLQGIRHHFIEGTVEDLRALSRAAENVEVIHHLAAMVSVPESVAMPDLCDAINVAGTANVIAAARLHQVKRIVFSSTCAVYGMVDRPIHCESDEPAPASPYAASKLAGEQLLAEFPGAVSLRYFNVYGPGQDPNGAYAAAIAAFAARARSDAPITVYGDGEQTRDFIHVDDVVRANLLAATTGSGVYNVSTGERITINELARNVISAADSKSTIQHAPARAGDVRNSRGDATRLKALGWSARVPLARGIAGVINIVPSPIDRGHP
ncbi:NAD-dependent epimerase/dehydratase family protein [Candidatus Sumerlaeota bacterium]|nr:NAD-dependent epimerase/dehydratase family protein [Candidatus Sumerlaeota bacterium]